MFKSSSHRTAKRGEEAFLSAERRKEKWNCTHNRKKGEKKKPPTHHWHKKQEPDKNNMLPRNLWKKVQLTCTFCLFFRQRLQEPLLDLDVQRIVTKATRVCAFMPRSRFWSFRRRGTFWKIRIRAIRVSVCVQQTKNPLSTYGREEEGSFIMTLSRILKQHLPFLREGEEKFSDDTPFCLPSPLLFSRYGTACLWRGCGGEREKSCRDTQGGNFQKFKHVRRIPIRTPTHLLQKRLITPPQRPQEPN